MEDAAIHSRHSAGSDPKDRHDKVADNDDTYSAHEAGARALAEICSASEGMVGPVAGSKPNGSGSHYGSHAGHYSHGNSHSGPAPAPGYTPPSQHASLVSAQNVGQAHSPEHSQAHGHGHGHVHTEAQAHAHGHVRAHAYCVPEDGLETNELQSDYVGALIATDVVFERPAVVPKTVHGFEHLIPALDGEMPDLHPLLGRVAEAARNEYTRLSDPLVAWRSESSLHGSISRLLRAVITPEAAERGTALHVSPSVRAALGLDLADVCPDLSVGISVNDLVIASTSEGTPILESPHAYAQHRGVIPALSGVGLDTDWFHFLFVEAKPGGVRAGTLRVLTAMREALELALRLFSAAAAADPHHSRRLGDMSTAYGVVTSGPCWEVHCMSIDDTPQGVRFKTQRLWEGHVDRAPDLMQFIALMRIAIVAAQRRSEIIGNWLWCLRNEGARKRGAPTPSPEEREVKRHSRNPSRVSTALPVRTGLFSVQASPTLSHATPSRAVTPLPPMSIPAALTPVAPPAAPSTAKTAPPTNGQAQRWSATQERIGRWRCDVEDPAPRLAASDI